MSRPAPALFLSLLLIVCAFASTGFAGATPFLQSQHEDLEPTTVVLEIELDENGSAAWTITHRYRLANDTEEAAFEELASEVERDPAPYRDRFRERMTRAVVAAENSTDREMTLENISVETDRTSIPQEYGVVRYTFRWTGFARLDDGRMMAGDAIYGLFLDDQSTLHIQWPEHWTPDEVSPSATATNDGRVTWRGPIDFGDDQPRVTLTRASGFQLLGLSPLVLVATLGGLVAIVGLGAAVWWRRTSETASAGATPDDELLSNEEQVLQLLESADGRMKQQDVVNELGWTDAKTSQVISDLREAGDIETFRLGRENVIRLPEAEAPLDEDQS